MVLCVRNCHCTRWVHIWRTLYLSHTIRTSMWFFSAYHLRGYVLFCSFWATSHSLLAPTVKIVLSSSKKASNGMRVWNYHNTQGKGVSGYFPPQTILASWYSCSGRSASSPSLVWSTSYGKLSEFRYNHAPCVFDKRFKGLFWG